MGCEFSNSVKVALEPRNVRQLRVLPNRRPRVLPFRFQHSWLTSRGPRTTFTLSGIDDYGRSGRATLPRPTIPVPPYLTDQSTSPELANHSRTVAIDCGESYRGESISKVSR